VTFSDVVSIGFPQAKQLINSYESFTYTNPLFWICSLARGLSSWGQRILLEHENVECGSVACLVGCNPGQKEGQVSLSHNFLFPFTATPFQGFYFQFCDVAKFGYRLESKVKKKRILLYFGDLVDRLPKYEKRKKIPQNLATLVHSKKNSIWVTLDFLFVFCSQEDKWRPFKMHSTDRSKKWNISQK